MSDTEAALLAAIVANPDDDAVRLVYAGWLDDQEAPTARQREALRARAAFIRLEIEMAGMMPDAGTAPNPWDHPLYRGLEVQAGALYERHHRDWFGNLDRLVKAACARPAATSRPPRSTPSPRRCARTAGRGQRRDGSRSCR